MIGSYSWDILSWIKRMDWRLKEKAKHQAWIKSLLQPVADLHTDFLNLNQSIDYKVKYSSQQQVLAALLNDLFDPDDRRISVATVNDLIDETIIYFKSENENDTVTYFKSESGDDTTTYFKHEIDSLNGFVVYVPAELSGKEDQIRAWVNRYKLADKTYRIVYI